MPKKQPKTNAVTAKQLAEKWSLTQGRISQLVADGMPLTSLKDAMLWRRENWDEKTAGPLPYYLKFYDEKFSAEQRVYDLLTYVHGVDPAVASRAASITSFANPCADHTGKHDYDLDRHGGHDRRFDIPGDDTPTSTWFVPQMCEDPDEWEWTEEQAKEILKAAQEIDRAALRAEGVIE